MRCCDKSSTDPKFHRERNPAMDKDGIGETVGIATSVSINRSKKFHRLTLELASGGRDHLVSPG